ncbi:hypothetical protein [Capybara microvirus Cap3_SP_414]|nr:hypothetical protein [Capybara microvirus Cap3_SP_414]
METTQDKKSIISNILDTYNKDFQYFREKFDLDFYFKQIESFDLSIYTDKEIESFILGILTRCRFIDSQLQIINNALANIVVMYPEPFNNLHFGPLYIRYDNEEKSKSTYFNTQDFFNFDTKHHLTDFTKK